MYVNWDFNLFSKEEKEMIVNWANYVIYFRICVVIFIAVILIMYKRGVRNENIYSSREKKAVR